MWTDCILPHICLLLLYIVRRNLSIIYGAKRMFGHYLKDDKKRDILAIASVSWAIEEAYEQRT